jgi:hypothetical protein
MSATETKTWKELYGTELKELEKTLEKLGFTLDDEQPHLSGERFLMTRNKLVLSGTNKAGQRVIIKAAEHPDGKAEIQREKDARDLLASLAFSKDALLFPKELYTGTHDGRLYFVTEYIPQEKVFVSYGLEEQFFMALRAFETQEAFHATTFEHLKKVDKIFPVHYAKDYFESFNSFVKTIENIEPDSVLLEILSTTKDFLVANKQLIDQYSNHLVHTDLVPHNFRVHNNKLYTLDAAAVEFGNKYEGWARFLNYMVIHNPELEVLLSQYLQKNRGERDFLDLRLMRAFKISYLIEYYVRSLPKTEGDLHDLTRKRINFWHRVLEAILDNVSIPKELVEDYKNKRDILRSDEEKKRQKEFAVA